MRTRTRVGLVAGAALLATSITPPGPASAGFRETWAYDVHASGMPTGDEPARTLESAQAEVSYPGRWYDDTVTATVTLGAEPTATTDAELHLVFGEPTESGCAAQWEHSLSTFTPGTGASRDGAQIQLVTDAPTGDVDRHCSYVELREPGDPATVLDRLEGTMTGAVIWDPPTAVVARGPGTVRVHRGEWSGVRVRLSTHRSVTRVVLRGRGNDLLTRDVVLDEEEIAAHGDTITFLPVKLRAKAERRLRIRAVAFDQDGHLLGLAQRSVRVRPR